MRHTAIDVRAFASCALLVAASLVAPPAALAQPKPRGHATAEPPALVPPKLLSEPNVPYPEGASGEAIVLLVITVTEEGAVSSAVAQERNEPFSSAASTAALLWRFRPATRDGAPVNARIRMSIAFKPPSPPPPPEEPKEPVAPPARPGQTPTSQADAAPRIEDVTIRGDRIEPSRTATLSRAEVRQLPGAFGDPFRAIEMMPGVTPVVSGLPFFFIRGAPPGNVGYFLDGIRVPVLFHVGVGPSVIHPGLISRVDLYPGGYPARFGRYSGGIVAGEATTPSPETHGEFNVRAFDAGAMIETPFARGRGIALFGGRYSYTAALFSLLSPATTLDYWDYQARVSYDLTADDRVSVFSFGSYDFLGQRTQTETLTVFSTEFHRVDLRYDHRLGSKGRFRAAIVGGLDRSRLEDDRAVRDQLVGARTELTYELSPRALLRAGTDVQIDRYDIVLGTGDLPPSTARIADYFPSRNDIAVGVRADVVLAASNTFEITPGARFDVFGSQGATAAAIDPRLAMRTILSPRARLLAALGIAHQPPAFVVPVPGLQPGGLRGGLQRAVQDSLGIELELGGGTVATASVFYNAFFDMSDPLSVAPREQNGCLPGTYPADSLAGDRGNQPTGNASPCGVPRFTPGTIGPDRSGGGQQGADSRGGNRAANAFEVRSIGSAYGLELFLKRRLTNRIGGFFSYTLSRSTRVADGRNFVATFDRTHVLNAALAYDLGRGWRAGARLVFYTGLPKAPDPTDPSSTRLPPFFRLDGRVEKKWQLGTRSWISLVAEWMNVTLNTEAVATRCTLAGCESQEIGPITIPSLGVEGGF